MSIDWRRITGREKRGVLHLLYFPPTVPSRPNGIALAEMYKCETLPVPYPRRPTHYAVVNPPEEN